MTIINFLLLNCLKIEFIQNLHRDEKQLQIKDFYKNDKIYPYYTTLIYQLRMTKSRDIFFLCSPLLIPVLENISSIFSPDLVWSTCQHKKVAWNFFVCASQKMFSHSINLKRRFFVDLRTFFENVWPWF